MEKRNDYSKPFLMVEKFEPQNYCAICYGMSVSRIEDNGVPGMQATAVTLEEGSNLTSPFWDYVESCEAAGKLNKHVSQGTGKMLYTFEPDYQVPGPNWLVIQCKGGWTRFSDCWFYPSLVTGSSVTGDWAMVEDVDNKIYYWNGTGQERDTNNQS